MEQTNPRRYYTISEAAKTLGITRAAVHRAIKQGRLDATRGEIVQVTHGWQIPVASLETYSVSFLHQQAGKKTQVRLTAYIPFRLETKIMPV